MDKEMMDAIGKLMLANDYAKANDNANIKTDKEIHDVIENLQPADNYPINRRKKKIQFSEIQMNIEKENVVYGDTEVSKSVPISSTDTNIQCESCMKTFTTKGSLKRHHERNNVCKQWLTLDKTDNIDTGISIHKFVEDTLFTVIRGKENDCLYCGTKFTSVGNLNRHFEYAITCNRMAIRRFRELITGKNTTINDSTLTSTI